MRIYNNTRWWQRIRITVHWMYLKYTISFMKMTLYEVFSIHYIQLNDFEHCPFCTAQYNLCYMRYHHIFIFQSRYNKLFQVCWMTFEIYDVCSYVYFSGFFSETYARGSTAQKLKFPIKDFFSNCDQIRSFLADLVIFTEEILMENFIFCCWAVIILDNSMPNI